MSVQRFIIDNTDQRPFFLLVEGNTLTIGGSGGADDVTVLEKMRVVRFRCEMEVEADHVTSRHDKAGVAGTPEVVPVNQVFRIGTAAVCLQADNTNEARPQQTRPHDPTTPELRKRLVVIDGADQGRSYGLPTSGMVTLGKDRKHADIALHDLYVARVHCLLKIDSDKVEVIDEGRHGLLINGQKTTQQVLNIGDVLRIGNSHLRLELATEGDEIAKVSGDGDGKAADMIAVLKDNPADNEVIDEIDIVEEPIEATIEDEEELPPNVSTRVRLLYQWRGKLTKISGQTFGHYQLGEVIGRGSVGVVFQADDLKTKQTVALKVFSPQFPYGPQELQRFAAGMKGLLPLRHANLVALYGAGKTGIYTWIAREYVAGESVAMVIRRQVEEERFNERRATRVAIHVARALECAQKHRLYHGNISPANILIQESDKVAKLADLMLGPILKGSQLQQAILEHRTPAEVCYLSPEQATPGAFVDQLADVYCLGAVIYAMLTGQAPFIGQTSQEILDQLCGEARVSRPSALNPNIAPALEKVVLRMLAKHQEDRYQTPTELLADLMSVAEKLGLKV